MEEHYEAHVQTFTIETPPDVALPTAEQWKVILLEQAILEAAEKNDDTLQGLLQEAIETMDEERADRLLDKVHQIQSEALRDARGWKETIKDD